MVSSSLRSNTMCVTIIEAANDIYTATPPSVGINFECELLLLGIATIPVDSAALFIVGVKNKENKNAVKKQNRPLNLRLVNNSIVLVFINTFAKLYLYLQKKIKNELFT